MAAPFQIMPAIPDETAEILGLEQLCQSAPWDEPIIRAFLVAAGLQNKEYLAMVLKEKDSVIAYALASGQGDNCWLSGWASVLRTVGRELGLA